MRLPKFVECKGELHERRCLYEDEVSECTGLSRAFLRSARQWGTGSSYVYILGEVMYPIDELEAWLEGFRGGTQND